MRTTSRHRLRLVAVICGIIGLVVAAVTGVQRAPAGDPRPAADSPLPPPLRLGLDSYLDWTALPYLEIGDRVAGQSTAAPDGSNNDATNVLGTLPDGQRVLFDQAGPGIVTFLRMQQTIGGPWRRTRDGGRPTLIRAADLGQPAPTRSPASLFPYPLSLNTAESQGSSVIATALPYAHDLRFTSSAANGNFYSLYRKLPIDLPLPATNGELTGRAVSVLDAAGTDIAPTGIPERDGSVTVGAGAPTAVTTISGSQEIRALRFRVPAVDMVAFGDARLRVYFNGEATPSVDAPIKYLAGNGAGMYQPVGRQLVAALPSGITDDGAGNLDVSLYWPMPFTAGARLELVSADGAPTVPVSWSVRYQPFTDPPNWVGTFHANYTAIPHPRPGSDMTFLDYRGSGKLVGTVINFGAVGGTLEGDPHIYLDDSRTPQIAGTGTEEWGMGGDYWNFGKQTTLPLAGLPSADHNPPGAAVDGAAEYRFLIADSIPFANHIVVSWEHGAVDDSTEPYRATMLWYGNPRPTAVRGDQVLPGDAASAAAHDYHASAAGSYPLTSGYEFTVPRPEASGTVVTTSRQAGFTMSLRADNVGAFLRRTLDSCVANQRATVLVDGRFAGTWYNAGASPRTGHGTDRCWRDDDFPLPRSLTAGKSSITITIVAETTSSPPNTVWTAASYSLFSFVTA